MTPEDLTRNLKEEARRLGFDLAGATAAVRAAACSIPTMAGRRLRGPDAVYPRSRAAYEHPRHVLDGVRSLLMLAIAYRTEEPSAPKPGKA